MIHGLKGTFCRCVAETGRVIIAPCVGTTADFGVYGCSGMAMRLTSDCMSSRPSRLVCTAIVVPDDA